MHKIEKVILPNVKHIIAVASGKGGVGKSTFAANIALTFAQNGYKTALVDADLFGPSIPKMFGLNSEQIYPQEIEGQNKLIPIEKFGVKIMSIGLLVNPKDALIWRGPMASSVVLQLFNETFWDEIDYMIVDLPPGTGDIPLTLCQQVDLDGVVIVTTPQQISLIDVRKAISLFQNKELNCKIIGIVENMSWFTPIQHPEEKYFLFGKDGGQFLAKEYNLELLSQIPLIEGMAEASDSGKFLNYTQSKIVMDIYSELNKKIINIVKTNKKNQIMKKIAIPTDDGISISSHFGKTKSFKIFELEDNKIVKEELKNNDFTGHSLGHHHENHDEGGEHQQHSHSNILNALQNCKVVIANGMGQRLYNDLTANNFEVFVTQEKNIKNALNLYLEGKLDNNTEVCCSHH